jgi:hypothetical protein
LKYTDVLGTAYRIEELSPDQMEGNEGDVICGIQRITLDATMGMQRKEQRLLHEVLHIIELNLLLNMTEKQVAIVSEVLYSLGFRVKTYTKERE